MISNQDIPHISLGFVYETKERVTLKVVLELFTQIQENIILCLSIYRP